MPDALETLTLKLLGDLRSEVANLHAETDAEFEVLSAELAEDFAYLAELRAALHEMRVAVQAVMDNAQDERRERQGMRL